VIVWIALQFNPWHRLVARHKLPAVYSHRSFITAGGLISSWPVPPRSRLRRSHS